MYVALNSIKDVVNMLPILFVNRTRMVRLLILLHEGFKSTSYGSYIVHLLIMKNDFI